MNSMISRRRFIVSSLAVAGSAALAGGAGLLETSSRRLKLGIIGVTGRGGDHVREIAAIPEAEVIALCDVDSSNLATGAKTFPNAAKFANFRDLLKTPGLEAVVIATPDHTHACITANALRAGLHVYCEKPLTHTIREVRTIMALAEKTRRVTQLGIQIHSMDNYRRVVELIRAGVIGKVREVHIWNGRSLRPIDPKVSAPPAALDYDLWLGPVSARPYHSDFHPFNWRRRWAFGEGMLGDIGCHLMDVAFWALDLKHPVRIESQGGGGDLTTICPDWIIARYEFEARGDKPAAVLTWYDPPKKPPMIASWNLPPAYEREGVVFIGEQGILYTNYGEHALLPADKFKGFKPPAPTIPSSPGHQKEWIEACLRNDPSAVGAPFSYGGLLTEAVLLGTIAFRAGKALEWDAQAMRFANLADDEKYLDYPHRPGWEV